APADGGEFGPDQSTRVTVTRSGASDNRDITLEFPIVRVDGVSEKIVGEIDNTGEHYLLTAYGSDESTNLGREAMVVLSSLRSRLTGPTGVNSLVLHADSSCAASWTPEPRSARTPVSSCPRTGPRASPTASPWPVPARPASPSTPRW
ncbi:MAG TPA: hypothetical protein VJY40_04200, partial [Corynebacterium sp.]|nr:hypothetical protein [Corynebacterium sp.]